MSPAAAETFTGSTPKSVFDTDQRRRMPASRWPFTKRMHSLKELFATWIPAGKELKQFLNPTRGSFDNAAPNQGKKIDHSVILDGHGRLCVRTMASGMSSGMTSEARPWFVLAVDNIGLQESKPVQEWLETVQKTFRSILGRSNIYGCLHSGYEEVGTFGTAAIFLSKDFNDVMRGRVFTYGEYYLGCGPDGRINTFARQFQMTVAQLVAEFGETNVSPSVLQKYKNNQTEGWVKVNMLIEPNDGRVPDMEDFENMPYRCLYWEEGTVEDRYLRLDGYKIFPVLVIRWDTTTSQDVYGKGPGWDVLGDVKMLQKQRRDMLLAVDKVGNPPVQVDASVSGEFNSLPGGVTRSSASVPNVGVRAAYQVNPDINAMQMSLNETKKAISEAMYSHLFLMMTNDQGPQKTAAEIYERQAEKLQILGPFLERFENEGLNLLIEWLFDTCYEQAAPLWGTDLEYQALIPPPPPELEGQEIKVKYVSILALAQKMNGVVAVDRWMASVANAAAIDPSATDIVDVDGLTRETAEMLAIPARLVASPEKIQAKREARAEAAEAAQNAALAESAAKAAGGAGKAIKDAGTTPMNQGSALDGMLAGVQ